MTRDGHKVALLSGELDVRQRETVIEEFRKASFRVLITTNLCSRGLDVPQASEVAFRLLLPLIAVTSRYKLCT